MTVSDHLHVYDQEVMVLDVMVLDHLNEYEEDVTVLDHVDVYNQDVMVLDHL